MAEYILFSQDKSPHSRLGNSLEWMIRAEPWIRATDVDIFFPWGQENFAGYFRPESPWAKPSAPVGLNQSFLQQFGFELNALNCASMARRCQVEYEEANNLKAFDWRQIIYSRSEDFLFIAGYDICLSDSELSQLLAAHKCVMIHEPFNIRFTDDSPTILPENWVSPNPLLIHEAHQALVSVVPRRNAGLHIRRGDYASFANGTYFFNDAYWASLIDYLVARDINVWIFSYCVEEETMDYFCSLGAQRAPNNYIKDFVLIGLMDLVIGPPSTYTSLSVQVARSRGNKVGYIQLPPLPGNPDWNLLIPSE